MTPETRRKFLALRNWMIDISKGNYSTRELSDKYDYLYSEYDTHLKRHRLKTNLGVIKSFVITSTEILENIAKLNFSNALKTGFEIFEKSSKLSEVKANAPGKEVGYIYDIEQNFNKK